MMEKTLQNKGELGLDIMNSDNFNILHSAVEGNNEKSLGVILKWINNLKEGDESIGKSLLSYFIMLDILCIHFTISFYGTKFEFSSKSLFENKLTVCVTTLGEMLDGESGDDCNTPLHLAYKNKNYKIMFELVKAGADPSVTNNFVFNTLHYAALDDDLDAIQAVVDGAREGGEEAGEKLQQGRESLDFNDFLPAMNTDNEEMIKVSSNRPTHIVKVIR